MLGLDFYKSVMPKIREELKDIEYSIILVTNLLSKDILEIAQMFDKVSTSYEPLTRFPKKKLFEMWEDSAKLLIDNNVDLGATVAMTKQTIDFGSKKLLDYLLSINLKNIHFGFFIPEGDGLVNIKDTMPEFIETAHYLKEITDLYMPLRGTGVYINPVESMITSLTEERPMDDIVCPIISGSIDINWDGNCNSCLEAGGAINPDYSGNIFKKDIIEIVENETFKKEVLAAKRPKKPCLTCDYHSICQGACSVLFKYYDDDMEDCPGFKTWIDYLVGIVNKDYEERMQKNKT